MEWEADFLHALQTTRNSFLDVLWSVLTLFGEEVVVIAVIMLVYWCIDKRKGFKMMNVYFLSCAVVAGVKALAGRTRPFDRYPGKVESVGDGNTDPCFPSGHTNSATTLAALCVREFPKSRKFTIPIGIVIVLFVMFSRMYLGQHYPTDVLAGAAAGVLIVLLFGWLYDFLGNKEEYLAFVLVPAAVIATVFIGIFAMDTGFADTALKLTGVMSSVYVCYFLQKRVVRFDAKASVRQNIVKYLIGAAGAMVIFLPFELSFVAELSLWITDYLRFFLLGVWLVLGAPALFGALGLCRTSAGSENIRQNG